MIWIVLVQALTALSVFLYFRRDHPSEQSWKTTVCAWIGFAGQLSCSRSSTTTRRRRRRWQRAVRQGAPHDRVGYVVRAHLVAWHHRRARAGASLGYAYYLMASNPEKYALMGRFVNEAA